MKTITNIIYPPCALLAFACFPLSPQSQAANTPNTPDPGPLPISNTADGQLALAGVTGLYNSAFGIYALLSNGAASFNTGVGADVLLVNTENEQTAVGAAVLFSNTTGANNTGVGAFGLVCNGTASDNTAIGHRALDNNNTAVGGFSLFNNVDGSENTALGIGAGQNVIVGFNNTYVGDFVGTLAADESSTIRIGDLSNGNGSGSLACFIGGIFNNFQPVGGSVVEVTLDLTNDKLGWDVGPNNQGFSAPAPRGAPQPRSRQQLPGARPQRQAMLNDKVEKLQATVAQQQKQIETLTAQLKEQAAQIQKVSAQLEVNKPAPQTVANK